MPEKASKSDKLEDSCVHQDPDIARDAQAFHKSCHKLLSRAMNVHADLSPALFYDLALHLREDIRRQAVWDTKGIRPAKYAAYLAFWIRKIKPISLAFDAGLYVRYNRSPPRMAEIVDINEKVAIRLAFDYISKFNEKNKLTVHKVESGHCGDCVIEYNKEKYKRIMNDFCYQKLANDGKCVLETLISDMRYRTFGPHHLVHLFDQFVFRLST
jgi:hypothetical protein